MGISKRRRVLVELMPRKPDEIAEVLEAIAFDIFELVCQQVTGAKMDELPDEYDRMAVIEKAEAIIEAWQHGHTFTADKFDKAHALKGLLRTYSALVADMLIAENGMVREKAKAYRRLN